MPRTCGSQGQTPPAAYLPLAAGLPDQPLHLGLTLQPFTAVMGQLSECFVMHHGVSSSLFPGVERVGLYKWARFRCSRNEPSFPGRITDAEVHHPVQGRTEFDFPFPCRLARQASAGPAGYAVKRRGQPARRIAVLSNADLLPALSRAMCPATKQTVCRLAAALSNINRNARRKSALHLVVHEHELDVPAGGVAANVRRFHVEPVAAVAMPARVPTSSEPEAKAAA